MKLLANGLNGNYLHEILLNAPKTIEWVKVAVAYATGAPEVLNFCTSHSIPLQFWGRMDESIPVSSNLLERFLKLGPNYQCKLIWKYYHPKIIWFHEYGAYVGSANLTDSAWNRNIECGLWFDQDDLVRSNLLPELDSIYREIDKVAEPLTQEILSKIKSHEKLIAPNSDYGLAKRDLKESFDTSLGKIWAKKFEGLGQTSKFLISNRRKTDFLLEWNETLQLMRQIQEEVILDANRPSWVRADVPKGVQIDQFLHAFYYENVIIGHRAEHEDFHAKNAGKSKIALQTWLAWWSKLPAFPDVENVMYEQAPFLRDTLSENELPLLDEKKFVDVCQRIHAFVTSARQTKNQDVGLPPDTQLDLMIRAEFVSRWVWSQRTLNGKSIREMLQYVLYGGPIDDVTERIWDAAFTPEWHIPRFGLSCIGEIVGWAMPDRFPPRNGRTSKALYALGYDVTLHTV